MDPGLRRDKGGKVPSRRNDRYQITVTEQSTWGRLGRRIVAVAIVWRRG